MKKKFNFLYDNWKRKESESEEEYEARLYPEISIFNIAKLFNYECFNSITDKRMNIYEAIQISCNADEPFWQAFNSELCPEAGDLTNSILIGDFFKKISNKLSYIPIAEWNTFPPDDIEGKSLVRYGIIKFTNPKKYILINFYYGFPDGNDCWLIKNLKNKIDKKFITEFVYKSLKQEMYCPQNIYLFDDFKWNIKKIESYLSKQTNLYEMTTKIWKISKSSNDPHVGEYFEGPGEIKSKPLFSKKFPTD